MCRTHALDFIMLVTVSSKRIKPLRFNSLADATVFYERETVKVKRVSHTQQLALCAVLNHAHCIRNAGALTTHAIDSSKKKMI